MEDYIVSEFAISLQGTSHINKGVVCQDYSATQKVNAKNGKRFVIAAIADGLGSCAKSDEGSKIAVTSAISSLKSYLVDGINFDGKVKEDILRRVFILSLDKINSEARNQGIESSDFLTTLTVAVYDVDTHELVFGHSGDGGLVALTTNGELENLTNRSKVTGQALNYVRPLADVSAWTFGKTSNIAAFAMMTDGVYDLVSPVYRELQNYKYRNYIPFFEPLFYSVLQNQQQTEQKKSSWIDLLNSDDFRKKVTDDISLVAVVNQKIISMVPPVIFDQDGTDEESKRKNAELYAALYPNLNKNAKS